MHLVSVSSKPQKPTKPNDSGGEIIHIAAAEPIIGISTLH